MKRTVGILCGGGDAPGLNAVIRAVVKYGVGQRGWDLWGFEDSFNGLLETPQRIGLLTPVSCRGILQRGGSPVAVDRLLATRFGVGADRKSVV